MTAGYGQATHCSNLMQDTTAFPLVSGLKGQWKTDALGIPGNIWEKPRAATERAHKDEGIGGGGVGGGLKWKFDLGKKKVSPQIERWVWR